MIVLCASVQNMVMGIRQSNTVANSRSEIIEFSCYSVIRHREPVKFNDQIAYRSATGTRRGSGVEPEIFQS
jgi:hypothetical protein